MTIESPIWIEAWPIFWSRPSIRARTVAPNARAQKSSAAAASSTARYGVRV